MIRALLIALIALIPVFALAEGPAVGEDVRATFTHPGEVTALNLYIARDPDAQIWQFRCGAGINHVIQLDSDTWRLSTEEGHCWWRNTDTGQLYLIPEAVYRDAGSRYSEPVPFERCLDCPVRVDVCGER